MTAVRHEAWPYACPRFARASGVLNAQESLAPILKHVFPAGILELRKGEYGDLLLFLFELIFVTSLLCSSSFRHALRTGWWGPATLQPASRRAGRTLKWAVLLLGCAVLVLIGGASSQTAFLQLMNFQKCIFIYLFSKHVAASPGGCNRMRGGWRPYASLGSSAESYLGGTIDGRR